jgi:hypothetical protein
VTALLVLTALDLVLAIALAVVVTLAWASWREARTAADRFHAALASQTRETARAEHLAVAVERLHTAALETPKGARNGRVLTREVDVPATPPAAPTTPLRASTRPFEPPGETP